MNHLRPLYIRLLLLITLIMSLPGPGKTAPAEELTPGEDTAQLNKGRLTAVLATEAALYAGSITGLYFMWYSDYPQSSFHFFNDQGEWMQMDKIGHMTASYYISRIGYSGFRWAGVDRKRSVWYGSLLSFTYMTSIEVFDGFSAEWGFSWTDFAANTAGCFMFIGQQLGWREQRFLLKYSFHTTIYPEYNPELLGSNLIQQMVKDYNGMTFWLSGNISSFLPETSKFPRWINVSIGYGAEGMTGATDNTTSAAGITAPEFERYRQFYLSLDVDLTRIRTRSKVLRGIFSVVNFVKVPFPTLEINTLGNVKFHYLYF